MDASSRLHPLGTPAVRDHRRRLVVFVVMMGVLMTVVDTTIVVLGLPAMERSLRIPLSAVIWVIIAYILVVTVLATQVGRLGRSLRPITQV